IAAGTVIYFTDNEWTGSSFVTGESNWSWTATADVAAGTLVTMDGIAAGNTATSNLGTIAFTESTARGIETPTEGIFAYVAAPNAPSAFLTAYTGGNYFLQGSTGPGVLTNTGLTDTATPGGTTAISWGTIKGNPDIATYVGPTSGYHDFAD